MSYPDHMIKYWKENNIPIPVEKVVCAANKFEDGTIICGARHWDSIMRCVAECLPLTGREQQGFINQWGVFLDRKEALEVVKNSGQPFDAERNGATDMLFSEGLY